MYLLTTKATPQPFLWEMALLGTIIPTLIGWSALGKNNVGRMKIYFWLHSLFRRGTFLWIHKRPTIN